MKRRFPLFDRSWWSFQWRYLKKHTPWDTQITPPEVMAFVSASRPGRALDLGCGTGTNAITLAKHGWQVTGVDFAPQAILAARRKAVAQHLEIDFRVGDVTDLIMLEGPFDYALDIGCLHSIAPDQQQRYAKGVQRLLRPGATFMLYAWLPRIWQGKRRGIAAESIQALLEPGMQNQQIVIGEEGGGPSAWYWFIRLKTEG
jgi:SAM-dependent methyltransferase